MESGTLTLYRECTPVVDTVYSADSDESPVETITDAVATAADEDPLETASLYDYVDSDAINDLFRHTGRKGTEMLLCFSIETWNVFVRGDGKIRVCDATQTTSPEPVFG